MSWGLLFSNPRAKLPSPAEKAARRLQHAASYLLGYKASAEPYDEPTRERWLVTVDPRYGPAERFWVYDDHILGARRRYTKKGLHQGDPDLARIVDELDAALEAVGGTAPYAVWRVDGKTKTLEGPAYSMQEAVERARRVARREGTGATVVSSTGRVLRRIPAP